MGLSINTVAYEGGSQVFPVNFVLGYLDRDDVQVQINDETVAGVPVYRDFIWIDDNNIEVLDTLEAGDEVTITRTVTKTALDVNFSDGDNVTDGNLDRQAKQALMMLHEIFDGRTTGLEAVVAAAYSNDANRISGFHLDERIDETNDALDLVTGRVTTSEANINNLTTSQTEIYELLSGLRTDTDRIDAAQNAGVIGVEELADLPTTDGSGRVAYVGGASAGIYADLATGWTKIVDLLPTAFDDRLSDIEASLDVALLTKAFPELDGTSFDGTGDLNFYDGTTIGGALTGSSRGLHLASGDSSGAGGKWILEYNFTAAQIAQYLGQTVKLVTVFGSTDNFLSAVFDGSDVDVSTTFMRVGGTEIIGKSGTGASAVYPGERVEQISVNELEVQVERQFAGNEDVIRLDFAFDNNVSFSEDVGLYVKRQYYVFETPESIDEAINTIAASGRIKLTNVHQASDYRAYGNNGAIETYNSRGWTAATGETAIGSFVVTELRSFNIPDGTRVRITHRYECSDDILIESPMSFIGVGRKRNKSAPRTTGFTANVVQTSTNVVTGTIDTDILGDESGIDAQITVVGSAVSRTSDAKLKHIGTDLEILSYPEGYTADGILNEYSNDAAFVVQNTFRTHNKTFYIDPAGGADYLRLWDGTNENGGGFSPLSRVAYKCAPGLYLNEIDAGRDINPEDWSVIYSNRPEREIVFDFRQPDGTAQQSLIDGFLIDESVDLSGCIVLAENNRYGVHEESAALPNGEIQIYKDITVIHYGADGWGSPSAFGSGGHSDKKGQYIRLRLESPTQPYGIHDNIDMEAPMVLHYRSSYFGVTTPGSGQSFGFNNIGGGLVSEIYLDHTVHNDIVVIGQSVNRSELASSYPANFNGALIERNGPAIAWVSTSKYDSLVLRSRDVEGSLASVGGDAGYDLFNGAVSIEGGVNYPGWIGSQQAIALAPSDTGNYHPDLSLATRLGDCSTTSKSLVVNFEGDETATLILDADYSVMNNATVLAALNTKLAASAVGTGRAFTIEQPWHNRAKVVQPDAEGLDLNRESFVIRKGEALEWVEGGVIRASSTTSKRKFAGIALEEALPGRPIRYQRKGFIAQAHLIAANAVWDWDDGFVLGDNGTLVFSVDEEDPNIVLRVLRTRTGTTDSELGRYSFYIRP